MSTSTDGFGSGVKVQRARGFAVSADAAPTLPGSAGQLVASAADTGGLFTLVRTETPAGTKVRPHVHSDTDECFFVLSGEYQVRCGDDEFRAPTGTFVYLPRGVPHTYETTQDSTKLMISIPGGIEHYYENFEESPDQKMHSEGVTHL